MNMRNLNSKENLDRLKFLCSIYTDHQITNSGQREEAKILCFGTHVADFKSEMNAFIIFKCRTSNKMKEYLS
ncbi:MAG: hypothetical protein CV087_21710 [Candidatus Brocadia sp. WS118]|nr:MAG: hypothetical protein CV087_21710 [Candidatus Brocadia sp. WS118]